MNIDTEKRLHDEGVKKGVVIEFYPAQPKTAKEPEQQPVPVDDGLPTASELLTDVLTQAEHMDKIVLLIKGKNGSLNLMGNVAGPGEALLVMELIKQQMLLRFIGTGPQQPTFA